MTDVLFLCLLFTAAIGLFAGVVTWPHWFVQSMCRHRLWALRDDVSDDILAGRLPYDHDAVRQLANHLEYAVHDLAHIHVIDVVAWHLATKRAPNTVRELGRIDLAGLSESERELFCRRRERMMFLTTVMIMLGSWIGLFYVGCRAVPRLVAVCLRALRGGGTRVEHDVMRHATEETIENTRLGQELREYVGFKVGNVASLRAVA